MNLDLFSRETSGFVPVGLLSAAEWPTNAMLPASFDQDARDLVSRLKVLAAVAEKKQQEAHALALELRRVRNEIRVQLDLAQALEASQEAHAIAAGIVDGSIAVTAPDLPPNFGRALTAGPARDLLTVPPTALVALDDARLVGQHGTPVPVAA